MIINVQLNALNLYSQISYQLHFGGTNLVKASRDFSDLYS